MTSGVEERVVNSTTEPVVDRRSLWKNNKYMACLTSLAIIDIEDGYSVYSLDEFRAFLQYQHDYAEHTYGGIAYEFFPQQPQSVFDFLEKIRTASDHLREPEKFPQETRRLLCDAHNVFCWYAK